MAGDKLQQGYSNNTFKQDWAFYPFTPGRGGATLTHTTVTRYTFWIDYDPFDVSNQRLVSQNVSFQVFSDSGGTTPIVPAIIVDQSNDMPDETIAATIATMNPGDNTTVKTAAVSLAISGVPPYYLDTKFTNQPDNSNYQTDQGRWVYNAYSGSGFGISRLGFYDGIAQSFVPTQGFLTAVWFKDLFRIGSTSDHTQYGPITCELFDASGNFINTIRNLDSVYPLQTWNDAEGTQLINGWNNLTFVTADDGVKYWTNIDQIQFLAEDPIPVTPGQTYYILLRQENVSSTAYYGVGSNGDSSGNYNNNGRYIYGAGYTATINNTTGVATYSAIGTNLSTCFETEGSVGRTAITFWWNSIGNGANNYWYGTPTTNEFKFLHLDYNQRI